MENRFERFVLVSSTVLLVAAALSIALGFLGLDASLPVAGGLTLLAGVTVSLRRLDTAASLAPYFDWLWVGPAVAAAAAVVGVLQGWTAGELQAVGGLVGLLGVVNLFLRPIYRLLSYVLGSIAQVGREIQEERS